MAQRSGYADLPLHYGKVPSWLYRRMSSMGGAILEAIIEHYGRGEVLSRLSDPYWFQSLGSVLGMDWHSSGITTSVLGALKSAINPKAHELGIYFAGGRGKYSRQTPDELQAYSLNHGLDGEKLSKFSRLTAKIDNTAVQDGFSLYLHSFIITKEGQWAVVQQGMNDNNRMARRYHWHSAQVKSFIENPHAAVCGINQGQILNLVDSGAGPSQEGILQLSAWQPEKLMKEAGKILTMPSNHEVQIKDVDLKRLGTVVATAYGSNIAQFEDLLQIKGLGPKTLRSLALVSEVIHGTPTRFEDPARFSFAHGGKDGHPFPVQTHVYDKSIEILKQSINKAKIDYTDKSKALKKLHEIVKNLEKQFIPSTGFYEFVEKEKRESKLVGGRTVFDKPKAKKNKGNADNSLPGQLKLF